MNIRIVDITIEFSISYTVYTIIHDLLTIDLVIAITYRY